MSTKLALHQALLAAFSLERAEYSDEAAADALTKVLMAFAEAVRGPAPVLIPVIRGEELSFISADSATTPGTAELIAEVRALICEIRAERQLAADERMTNNRLFRSFVGGMPGAETGGLPG